MINVVLCDDDSEFLEYIKKTIDRISFENKIDINIKTYLSGESMLFDLEDSIYDIDVMFLDVFMKELDGVETAEKLRQLQSEAQIIFISSDKSKVFDALEVMPLNYLIKGEADDEKIKKVFLKAVNLAEKNKRKLFVYKSGHETKYVQYKDILYFEIKNRVVNINCVGDEVKEFYSTMDKLEEELDQNQFIRIHRSFIVNMDKIVSFDSKGVLVKGDITLPLGRKYTSLLRNRYSEYLLESM